MTDVSQGETCLCAQTLLALQLLALVGNLTCLLLCLQDIEGITRLRGTIQAQDQYRL